jgi:hypothetical protein
VVVGAGEAVALQGAGERLGDGLDHRDGAALAALRGADAFANVDAAEHADALVVEVDVAYAEGEEFAEAESGERGGEEDRAVLSCGRREACLLVRARRCVGLRPVLLGGVDERVDVLGRVEREASGVVRDLDSGDVAGGVRAGELVRLARQLVDAAYDRDELRGGAFRDLAGGDAVVAPPLDRLAGDVLEPQVAECGVEVNLERAPVVALGRRLPLFLRAAMDVPVLARVAERRAAPRDRDADAAAEVGEPRVELLLRGPLREEAVRGTAAAGPRRPDRLALFALRLARLLVDEPLGETDAPIPDRAFTACLR